MEDTADAAKRLWTLCNVLRDDGITYHQYISELTLILFFKLASQLGVEGDIPAEYRWSSLLSRNGDDLLSEFKSAIKALGDSRNITIRDMFFENQTSLRNPNSLQKILHGIDTIRWNDIASSSIGDIYESLIARNAQESRYGAGQYFTPRALVEAIIQVHNPTPQDSVYDPAAGTAGFLVAAGVQARKNFGQQCKLHGNELVREVQRMAQMNVHLHDLRADIRHRDTLSIPSRSETYSLCLTNPPFGIRSDLDPQQQANLMFPTGNKQLAFLQHILTSLSDDGRAAVIVPDNVLFEAGIAATIRSYILNNFDLHTLLRLPSGIFYATGVKTTVLFFSRTRPTEETWVYDLRSRDQSFTRKRPISTADLEDFVDAFDSTTVAKRRQSKIFTKYSREELRELDDRLDLIGTPTEEPRQGSARATLVTIAQQLDLAATAAREMQELLDRTSADD